jgi:hypothetical protein
MCNKFNWRIENFAFTRFGHYRPALDGTENTVRTTLHICLNIHLHTYFKCINVLVSTTNASRNSFMRVYVETRIKYVFVMLATPSNDGP